ncbi:hypothetical protein HYPP_04054 [Hyphomicrobium sp. ghe19]|nr:hypothetical protein HYPP_04054 [Hyphomicrobium sp. ghe19]
MFYRTISILIMIQGVTSSAYAAGGAWVCAAYGYSMAPTRWHMVNGSLAPSRGMAFESAKKMCRGKGYNACKSMGCTNHSASADRPNLVADRKLGNGVSSKSS